MKYNDQNAKPGCASSKTMLSGGKQLSMGNMWRLIKEERWQEEEAMAGRGQTTDHFCFPPFLTVQLKLPTETHPDCQSGNGWCVCFSLFTTTHFLALMTPQAHVRMEPSLSRHPTRFSPPFIYPQWAAHCLLSSLSPLLTLSFVHSEPAHSKLNSHQAFWKWRSALRLFVSALPQLSH